MVVRRFPAIVMRTDNTDCRIICLAELSYYPKTDPLVVKVVFSVAGEPGVTWKVGRELMARGVGSPVPYGDGDIRMRCLGPGDEGVILCLKNVNGHADIRLPRQPLELFLEETFAEVPLGDEHFDSLIDEALKEILG